MTICVARTETLQDKLALPEPTMIVAEVVHAVLFAVNLTGPEKPFNASIEMIGVEAAPPLRTSVVGLTLIAKS